MATEIKVPRLGQGMEAGTVVKWLKAEGDKVEKGEPLYELDTEKVTQEVESDASGVLLKIAVAEGEVPVGTTIAIIGEPGEEVAAPEPEQAAAAEAPTAQEEGSRGRARDEERERGAEAGTGNGSASAAEAPAAPVAQAPEAGERIKASPLARRIARERGVELAALRGTGPDGRIVAEDVERAEAAPAAAAAAAPAARGEVERRELTSIRRTIARRLTEAWEVPVFQLVVSADLTRANQLLARVGERDPELRVTVTDLLTKVCAAALMRHRDVNVQYTDEAILVLPSANVAIAVAAPQGLVVPVIRQVERLSLAEIAVARADIVGRARENKLRREDLEDGTFTISNLGMFPVQQFTAILNPPQAAILAVGAGEDRPVARDGAIVVRPIVTLTGTFDHRAVDGAPAAQFLETVKDLIEDPALAL
jgi:pyruvate dehydrogenase E2 component (dihydrolipoamide acetyltransferase)